MTTDHRVLAQRPGRGAGRTADVRRPHAPGGRAARRPRAARHPALPHGRQRPLRGRLPQRGAADAVSRLADAGGGPPPHRGEPIPYLPLIRNTSCSWGVRLILRDLYDWREPITADNWRRLDAHDPRAGRRPRPGAHSILDRLQHPPHLHRNAPAAARAKTTTACNTRWNGASSRAANGASSTRPCTSWSVPGAARRRAPRRSAAASARPPTAPSARWTTSTPPWPTTSSSIPYDQVLSTATGISTDIDFRPVSDAEMAAALSRRAQAGPAERDIYASYINEAFLTAPGEARRRDRLPVQPRGRAAALRDRPAGCRSGRSGNWPR